MANGTKYNTKEELLAAIERVKYNQNFETSSEKIQNNDKDIVESLWHDCSCEINELHTTGVVFNLQPTIGVSSMSFPYSADMRNMLTVGDLLMQNSGRGVTENHPLIFPKGTVITDITGTPGDYTIMLSNPATYTPNPSLEFVFGDVVNYLEPPVIGPGTPLQNMSKIFRIPDNINLLIIDIDNTYGGHLRDIIALPYETNTPLNGTKLRAIFKNVNLWELEPGSSFNTLDGRLGNTWYDHFGNTQGAITKEAYFDFMWYNGIWFCDGIS
jgi:hypothetical protein